MWSPSQCGRKAPVAKAKLPLQKRRSVHLRMSSATKTGTAVETGRSARRRVRPPLRMGKRVACIIAQGASGKWVRKAARDTKVLWDREGRLEGAPRQNNDVPKRKCCKRAPINASKTKVSFDDSIILKISRSRFARPCRHEVQRQPFDGVPIAPAMPCRVRVVGCQLWSGRAPSPLESSPPNLSAEAPFHVFIERMAVPS